MPLRAHVHAAIWVQDKLVVYRRPQRGTVHVTLPGGRVKDRESVTCALTVTLFFLGLNYFSVGGRRPDYRQPRSHDWPAPDLRPVRTRSWLSWRAPLRW
jgi:hypothetical protein